MNASEYIARVKKAELLSSPGAGVLGAGISLLLPKQLAPYAIPIRLPGLVSHAVDMLQKHGFEQKSEMVRVRWAETLYWLCWLGLAALLIWIIVRQF